MFIGHILLESKIYFMFWLISLDIPNLTEDHINYGGMPFHLTADLKAISNIISFFIFISSYILDALALEKYIRKRSRYL